LLFEHSVRFDQILDGLRLASIDPAAVGGKQEPQREAVDHLAESSAFMWPM
jgi:hypothetical protein